MQTEVSQCTTSHAIPGEIFCLSVQSGNDNKTDGDSDPIIASKASTDPDTLYQHEAKREPDREEFALFIHSLP